MKIYLTGTSGVGKTSIVKELIKRDMNAIDIDDISDWKNKETEEIVGYEYGASDEWCDEHAWVCDVDKLKEVLAKSEHAVVAGAASNRDDYLPLFDKLYVLDCSPETIISRIKERTDNDYGKHPKELEKVVSWKEILKKEMIERGASILDCERPLEEVVEDVLSNFD